MVNAPGFLTGYLSFMTFIKHAVIMMLVAKELAATSKHGIIVTSYSTGMPYYGAKKANRLNQSV
jgi:hypothetical protein